MEDIEKYEAMEAWIAGKLQGKELANFEHRLQNDEAFAMEVKMHLEVDKHLSKNSKNAFRASLINIRKKIDEKTTPISSADKKKINFTPFLIITALILLASLIYFLFPKTESLKETTAPTSTTEQINPPSSNEESILPVEIEKEQEQLENSSIDKKEETPKVEKKAAEENESKEEKQAELYAANFTANPLLENEMHDFIRGNGIAISLDRPTAQEQWTVKNGSTALLFSGNLTSDSDLSNRDIQFYLYSNKQSDYEQTKPVWQRKVGLEKNNNQFNFLIEKNIMLAPGLYYFIFEDVEEESFLKVGSIKNQTADQ